MNPIPVCENECVHDSVVCEVRERLLDEGEYLDLADLFKLFGDPTRLMILHALEQKELCVCDLAALLNLTKSAVSHQLKGLRLSNLVKFRREGQNVYYSLADGHVRAIIDIGLEHLHE
ncbi:MAG: winged helix-turn-helix transcriptional regulator [Clostridia bacterium]|nr:winged helix-turn-helix transcriptional regulator [Clostridia bacterium]